MSLTAALPLSSPRVWAAPSIRPCVRVHTWPPSTSENPSNAPPPAASTSAAAPPALKAADSTFLCVHSRPQRLNTAVAYYCTADSTLYCGELPNAASVMQLKYRLSPAPTVILTSASVDSAAYCALQSNELQPMRSFTVKSLPPSAFSHETGLARLQLLRVADRSDVQQHIDRFRHRMYLRALVDIDNPILCGCLGALLSHIVTLQLPGQSTDSMTVATIRSIPSASIVHCDALTVRTLGIFASEAHPGTAGTIKEGVSVYAMLNRTKSGVGGRMLREWLAWPTNDRSVLEARWNAIDFFMRAENEAPLAAITASLRQCLHHLLSIDEAVSHLNDSLPLIQSFHIPVRQQLSTLLQSITTILDLHADHPTHLTIQPDIDTRLDTLKHNRTQLPYLLAQLVAEDADYGGELEGWQFVYVYMQQVGFLVRMRSGGEEARWEDGDWLFDDGGYDFYKSERCRQLDDEIGDVDSVIKDVEDAFVRELQSRVEAQAASITALAQRTYELDCYMALASTARDMHLTRPQLNDDSVLHITRGRHLLQEKFVDPFIPNDTSVGELGKQGGQVHIITGPNRVSHNPLSTFAAATYTKRLLIPTPTRADLFVCQSGKSVYMEQVGLIAYLALCGSFVPAQSAVVGLLDGIYTCVSEVDSVTSDMSSFCRESAHMAYMQRHCTGRSLCLIDEYGKGTATDHGVALLTAALQCWAERSTSCPLVLASTHYHEMFTLGLIRTDERMKAYTMSFIDETQNSTSVTARGRPASPASVVSNVSRSASARIPSIIPLFKLQPGVCADSHALSCSKAAGLPTALLDRAASLMSAFHSSQRVTAWQYVLDVRRAEKAETDARLWAAFTRLAGLGLEKCGDEELDALRAVLRQEREEMMLKADEENGKPEMQQPHRSASRASVMLEEQDNEDQPMRD